MRQLSEIDTAHQLCLLCCTTSPVHLTDAACRSDRVCVVQDLVKSGFWARNMLGLTHAPNRSVAASLPPVSSLQVCHPSSMPLRVLTCSSLWHSLLNVNFWQRRHAQAMKRCCCNTRTGCTMQFAQEVVMVSCGLLSCFTMAHCIISIPVPKLYCVLHGVSVQQAAKATCSHGLDKLTQFGLWQATQIAQLMFTCSSCVTDAPWIHARRKCMPGITAVLQMGFDAILFCSANRTGSLV